MIHQSRALLDDPSTNQDGLENVEKLLILTCGLLLQHDPEEYQKIIDRFRDLALIQIKLGKWQDAAASFRRAVQHVDTMDDKEPNWYIFEEYSESVKRMAWFYLKHGSLEDAEEFWDHLNFCVRLRDPALKDEYELSTEIYWADLNIRRGKASQAEYSLSVLLEDYTNKHGLSYEARILILDRLRKAHDLCDHGYKALHAFHYMRFTVKYDIQHVNPRTDLDAAISQMVKRSEEKLTGFE